MRFAAGIEYDGTDFSGWQSQRDARTIQGAIEAAVSQVAAQPVTVHGAGRTDSGVHARGQVMHFDSQAVRLPDQWLFGVNSALPADVSIRWLQSVDDSFDARRAALWRRYRYLLHCSRSPSALAARRAWWLREPLDAQAMRQAGANLIGEHDFSTFRAAGCQSHTPMRNLMRIDLSVAGEFFALEFTANAFVYHMVRNLVGTLVEIGRGRQHPDWAAQLLTARDRTAAAATAPAHGLTLEAVGYPKRFGLPEPVPQFFA